jgi:hypothetical protein
MEIIENQTTPIELYVVKGHDIYIKREDLYGNYPAPCLGKLRGLKIVLERINESGVKLVGCWDTRISKLGQGVAVLSSRIPGMGSIISYPTKKGEQIPEAIKIAQSHGAEIYTVRGNHVSICYSQVKKYVEDKNGVMLPFGLECADSVKAIACEAGNIPQECIENGTLILSCGSGVTLAGILSGLRYEPSKVIGISSGRSIEKIKGCIGRYIKVIPDFVEIIKPIYPYYEQLTYECPFPCDPYYDLKAWKYLIDNIETIQKPIIFWNIGG